MTKSQVNWHWMISAQARSGVPYIEGIPGDAKTAIANAFATALKRKAISQILSQQTPEDVLGLPRIGKTVVVNAAGEKREMECVRYIPNEAMVEAMYGNCVVILDELPHASKAVQAANQEVWLNNPPTDPVILAIGNPADLATDSHELSIPVINRMCMLEWEDDFDLWAEGMENDEFPAPSIPILPENWQEFAKKWKKVMVQFSRSAEGTKHFNPLTTYPKRDDERGKPWRSKRSWFNAAVNLGACESVGATQETAMKILSGFVGEGPAMEFMEYYNSLDYPSAQCFYDDPDTYVSKMPRQLSIAHSIVKGVLAYGRNEISKASSVEDKGARWEQLNKFLDAVYRANKELAASAGPAVTKLKPAGYEFKERNGEYAEARREFSRFGKTTSKV